jgi:hypothetical protein
MNGASSLSVIRFISLAHHSSAPDHSSWSFSSGLVNTPAMSTTQSSASSSSYDKSEEMNGNIADAGELMRQMKYSTNASSGTGDGAERKTRIEKRAL